MLSSGLLSCQLHSITFGLMLLMFMIIHLFQFRFADTEQYFLAFLRAVTGIGRKTRPAGKLNHRLFEHGLFGFLH